MAEKLIKCPVCGAEMAAKAKSCPSCGAKNKKPIYKKWWFWVIAVFLVIGIVGSMSGGSDEQAPDASGNQKQGETVSDAANDQKEEITYTAYNVTELFDALNNNALNAQQAYKDQYVEITGYLGTIDSSGKYIGVGAKSDDYNYFLDEVLCYIKNDDQLNQIAAMSKDDSITLRGIITNVGEVMGYTLDIDSIG